MAQALDDLLDSLEDADDATREEAAKALALAKSGAGREQAQRLIAPGAIKRMFADRHQFNMGKAQ